MAADVADHLGLDTVLWMPAGQPPHKPIGAVSSNDLRLEMTQAAVEADPRFEVSTLELERRGPSYTVDTVRALRAEHPGAKLFVILGVDQFKHLSTWRDPQALVRLARVAVMDREGESAAASTPGLAVGTRAVFVPVRRFDISSTAVREAVRAGEDTAGRVAPEVAEIIRRERQYSGDDARRR